MGSEDTNSTTNIDDIYASDIDSPICSTVSCSKENGEVSWPAISADCDHEVAYVVKVSEMS